MVTDQERALRIYCRPLIDLPCNRATFLPMQVSYWC
jgi:hypothetical protein